MRVEKQPSVYRRFLPSLTMTEVNVLVDPHFLFYQCPARDVAVLEVEGKDSVVYVCYECNTPNDKIVELLLHYETFPEYQKKTFFVNTETGKALFNYTDRIVLGNFHSLPPKISKDVLVLETNKRNIYIVNRYPSSINDSATWCFMVGIIKRLTKPGKDTEPTETGSALVKSLIRKFYYLDYNVESTFAECKPKKTISYYPQKAFETVSKLADETFTPGDIKLSKLKDYRLISTSLIVNIQDDLAIQHIKHMVLNSQTIHVEVEKGFCEEDYNKLVLALGDSLKFKYFIDFYCEEECPFVDDLLPDEDSEDVDLYGLV